MIPTDPPSWRNFFSSNLGKSDASLWTLNNIAAVDSEDKKKIKMQIGLLTRRRVKRYDSNHRLANCVQGKLYKTWRPRDCKTAVQWLFYHHRHQCRHHQCHHQQRYQHHHCSIYHCFSCCYYNDKTAVSGVSCASADAISRLDGW